VKKFLTAALAGLVLCLPASARTPRPVPCPAGEEFKIEQVQGKLRYVVKQFGTGKVLFMTDSMPDPVMLSWVIEPVLVVGEKTYRIEPATRTAARQIPKLIGQEVVVTADLKGDLVRAISLEPAPRVGS
jgi:hypothetical protein